MRGVLAFVSVFRLVLVSALSLTLLDLPVLARPAPRERVLSNLAASRRGRESSRFRSFAAAERRGFREVTHRNASRVISLPDGASLYPGSAQPRLLVDKGERLLKRKIRRKAARIGRSSLDPWQKIDRIQRMIWRQVHYAGDTPSIQIPYYRFIKEAVRNGRTVQLRDYLKRKEVLCLELACLTQVALEDAGFRAGLAGGVISKDGMRIGRHAWNTVLLKGKRRVVDTTNPQFNGEDPLVLEAGNRDGWRLARDSFWPDITPR